MNNVCIIPARGGSKRIPQKNIKPFCGKPIIAYAIEQALASKCFSRVIVSTDDEKIKQVAEQYGAEVPFIRPAELSDDYTGTLAVNNHAIQWLQAQGEQLDYVCTLYATSPFIKAENLVAALKRLQQANNKCYCFGVCEYPVPIQQAFKIKHGDIEMFQPDEFGKRTQDLETAFFDAGQFYWGTVDGFLAEKCMFSADAIPFILPKYEVHDIDTLQDWKLAEAMYRALETMHD